MAEQRGLKEFEVIFSRFDTMQDRDKLTNERQTNYLMTA